MLKHVRKEAKNIQASYIVILNDLIDYKTPNRLKNL